MYPQTEPPATQPPDPNSPTELLADGALSVRKTAEFCSISRTEVYRATYRGELETFYHGRIVLIPKKAVVAWLAAKLAAERTAQETGGKIGNRQYLRPGWR